MDENPYRLPLRHRVIMVTIFLTAWWLFEPIYALLNQRPIDPKAWLFYGLSSTMLVILVFAFARMTNRWPRFGLVMLLGAGFAAVLGITGLLALVFG